MVICATCAVEYDEPVPEVCPLCADERQWVPASGQSWITLDELRSMHRLITDEPEPGLTAIRTDPEVGIGQVCLVVRTPAGALVWDPVGMVDDVVAEQLLQQGPVMAVAASHPHMFGVQVEWSRRLGDVPVLVAEADREWLGRKDSCIDFWSGTHQVAEGLTLHQVGGHFVGSAVAHWGDGADGRGVLLTGDSVFPNPDRRSIGFLRSYPNKLPLSGAVVQRLAARLEELTFDRIYGNFGNTIPDDARAVLRFSADRHSAWVRGDFDHLT